MAIIDACISGVRPSTSAASTFAPAARSSLVASMLPARVANPRAVVPWLSSFSSAGFSIQDELHEVGRPIAGGEHQGSDAVRTHGVDVRFLCQQRLHGGAPPLSAAKTSVPYGLWPLTSAPALISSSMISTCP